MTIIAWRASSSTVCKRHWSPQQTTAKDNWHLLQILKIKIISFLARVSASNYPWKASKNGNSVTNETFRIFELVFACTVHGKICVNFDFTSHGVLTQWMNFSSGSERTFIGALIFSVCACSTVILLRRFMIHLREWLELTWNTRFSKRIRRLNLKHE